MTTEISLFFLIVVVLTIGELCRQIINYLDKKKEKLFSRYFWMLLAGWIILIIGIITSHFFPSYAMVEIYI